MQKEFVQELKTADEHPNGTFLGFKETPEEKAKRLNDAKIRNFHAQGVKQWHYRGGEVWARDKKNADRKAKNKGYL